MASKAVPVPPPICSLALGVNGFGVLLMHWARITGTHLAPAPLYCSLTAAALLLAYLSNSVRCPNAIISHMGDTAALPALNAGQAVLSGLTARFGGQILPTPVLQLCLLACYVLGIGITSRFLLLCFRKGQLPDPSWFPAILLGAMGNLTSQPAGPDFLRSKWQFAVFVAALAMLLPIVTYRILVSKARDSVAPNAGMALLMAPCSFFTFLYLATGKPFGDELGLVLFACSTVWFLMTLRMLFQRRKLWIGAFHPSYVAFTFPAASTATAALLASEKLPAVAGSLSRTWAGVVSLATAVVIFGVGARFLIFVVGVVRPAAPPAETAKKAD